MAVREVLGMGGNAAAVARLVDFVLALTALVLALVHALVLALVLVPALALTALVLVRGVGNVELDGTYEK